MPVMKADLGPLTKISEGGYGVVYGIAQYRMPGDPTTLLAYKEFTTDVASSGAVGGKIGDLPRPAAAGRPGGPGQARGLAAGARRGPGFRGRLHHAAHPRRLFL